MPNRKKSCSTVQSVIKKYKAAKKFQICQNWTSYNSGSQHGRLLKKCEKHCPRRKKHCMIELFYGYWDRTQKWLLPNLAGMLINDNNMNVAPETITQVGGFHPHLEMGASRDVSIEIAWNLPNKNLLYVVSYWRNGLTNSSRNRGAVALGTRKAAFIHPDH